MEEALDSLRREHPDKSQLIDLRYYAGLPLADAASALGMSVAKAKRDWAYARAYLYDKLADMG
jgi:DNA-directed RNA polymerase specialized sigma24 family protein